MRRRKIKSVNNAFIRSQLENGQSHRVATANQRGKNKDGLCSTASGAVWAAYPAEDVSKKSDGKEEPIPGGGRDVKGRD